MISWMSRTRSESLDFHKGKITVFVEYNFDTAHKYTSDLIEFKRIVTWIVYVVTKDNEVHMCSDEVRSLSDVSAALKDINRKLSKGAKDADRVKKALMDFYRVLIEPISDLLHGMDVEDKLVFADEGVVGLPRAFLLAGVPCIVASQWELEDNSSPELMVEFYREMRRGTTDAAFALRAAMIHMMKSSDVESGSSKQVVEVYKWSGYLV
uniref:CHAT domain-containing protein n=2 Tax=Physcomitrium patens TaxID=3218 RepID=A0A7I4A0D3_PHYPA